MGTLNGLLNFPDKWFEFFPDSSWKPTFFPDWKSSQNVPDFPDGWEPWMGPPPPSAVLMIMVPRHELIKECNAIHTLKFVCQEVDRCTTRGESQGTCMPQPSFETHRRWHYKSTKGVSVTPQSSHVLQKKFFLKSIFLLAVNNITTHQHPVSEAKLLLLNVNKTKCVLFTKTKLKVVNLVVDAQTIENVKCFKFLGFWIDLRFLDFLEDFQWNAWVDICIEKKNLRWICNQNFVVQKSIWLKCGSTKTQLNGRNFTVTLLLIS